MQAELLSDAWMLARAMPEDASRHRASDYFGILWFLRAFKDSLRRSITPAIGLDDDVRRFWILLDLVATHIRGILRDGVLIKGFLAIDGEDWAAWLRRHGASTLTVNSAVVRATYDYVFGFRQGDVSRPAISAGVCVQGDCSACFFLTGRDLLQRCRPGWGMRCSRRSTRYSSAGA